MNDRRSPRRWTGLAARVIAIAALAAGCSRSIRDQAPARPVDFAAGPLRYAAAASWATIGGRRVVLSVHHHTCPTPHGFR